MAEVVSVEDLARDVTLRTEPADDLDPLPSFLAVVVADLAFFFQNTQMPRKLLQLHRLLFSFLLPTGFYF